MNGLLTGASGHRGAPTNHTQSTRPETIGGARDETLRRSLSCAATTALLAALSAACGPTTIRAGQALTLPTGPAESPCERAAWLEVAPARVFASDSDSYETAYVTVIRQVSREDSGLGVFRPGSSDPEPLEDVLPRMGEPELRAVQLGRVEPIHDREDVATGLVTGGGAVGLLGAGLLIGGAAEGERSESFEPLLISGAVFALSGVIVQAIGLFGVQPPAEERTYAAVRDRTFVDGEADVDAVAGGVDRLNAATRTRCTLPFAPAARYVRVLIPGHGERAGPSTGPAAALRSPLPSARSLRQPFRASRRWPS